MKKLFCSLTLIALICAFTSFVFAQEEKKGSNNNESEESAIHDVARWANFAVLFGGLAYLLRKPMREFFQTRRTDIASGLQRAQAANAGAQSRMDEIEHRLANLSAEVAALKTEAERESLNEREKILAEAKREVERIVEQSRQEIDRIARTVERQIKETVADHIIDRASTTLRTEMTQDDQKRVIVRFIKSL